jgi:hypothetical protein
MFPKRIDANQNELVKTFRDLGASVWVTSMLGKGGPDFVVGLSGRNYLVEAKDGKKVDSRQSLTHSEAKFHATWKGQVIIIKNVQEVIDFVNQQNKE